MNLLSVVLTKSIAFRMAAWPSVAAVAVRAVPNKGRGLIAVTPFPAGAAVLCEEALASAESSGTGGAWRVAAALAKTVLQQGREEKTHGLEPCVGDADESQLMREESVDAESALATLVASDAAPAERLRARRLMHVVVRNALALCGRQAICVRGAMINHSCAPNATHQGFTRTSDGALCLCIRAVRPIAADEEITISYVADLAATHAERTIALEHHGFAAERRACDEAMERW